MSNLAINQKEAALHAAIAKATSAKADMDNAIEEQTNMNMRVKTLDVRLVGATAVSDEALRKRDALTALLDQDFEIVDAVYKTVTTPFKSLQNEDRKPAAIKQEEDEINFSTITGTVPLTAPQIPAVATMSGAPGKLATALADDASPTPTAQEAQHENKKYKSALSTNQGHEDATLGVVPVTRATAIGAAATVTAMTITPATLTAMASPYVMAPKATVMASAVSTVATTTAAATSKHASQKVRLNEKIKSNAPSQNQALRQGPSLAATSKVAERPVQLSVGRSRKALNTCNGDLKKHGIFASFQTAFSTKTINGLMRISHVTLTSAWNKLPARSNEPLYVYIEVGTWQQKCGNSLASMAACAAVPVFMDWREPNESIYYAGHWKVVHEETVKFLAPVSYLKKKRCMRITLAWDSFDVDLAETMAKIEPS